MSQKVTAAELRNHEIMRREQSGTTGMIQCDGCPSGLLVRVGRPGHLPDCGLCQSHCSCFHTPNGVDFEEDQ